MRSEFRRLLAEVASRADARVKLSAKYAAEDADLRTAETTSLRTGQPRPADTRTSPDQREAAGKALPDWRRVIPIVAEVVERIVATVQAQESS